VRLAIICDPYLEPESMTRTTLATLALVTCSIFSEGLFAQQLITASDPDVILNFARGFGGARLSEDDTGDPMIDGRIEGTRYVILFYGCENGADCSEIQFSAGWSGYSVSVETLNAWNRDYRFGKAYLDKEGDPLLQMDVNLEHGISSDNLDSTFEWWAAVLNDFTKKVLE
jgi:hypothetical protein